MMTNDTSLRRLDGTHRVVITGVGAVTAAGVGAEALMDAVMSKRCCIAPIQRFDASEFGARVAGEITPEIFDPTQHGLSKKEARRNERFVQYAIVASDEAMSQANLNMDAVDANRIGCIFGSGIGGLDEFQRAVETLGEKGPKRVNPLMIPMMIGNIAAGTLSIRYGLKGDCLDVTTACASGAHSIGTAVRDIRHGYLDAALVGGSEESINQVAIAGFANLGALSKSDDPTRASMPFDVNRSGFVAGEGAGALFIESLEHALKRNATVIAEIVGYGSTGDAHHVTAPDPSGEGIYRAMRMALDEGGYGPEDLGHVNAHGTGTHANDLTESSALRMLCGEELGAKIPVCSVKGTIGHTLGAAGALEAIVTALSVSGDFVPPTTGYSTPDPEAPAHVLTEPWRDCPQKVALSNSLGFGGHNAVLAIAPYRS